MSRKINYTGNNTNRNSGSMFPNNTTSASKSKEIRLESILNTFDLNKDDLALLQQSQKKKLVSIFDNVANSKTQNGLLDGEEITVFRDTLQREMSELYDTLSNNAFADNTADMNNQNPGSSKKILDVASNHLGLYEITSEEAKYLPEDLINNNTQMHVIGKYAYNGPDDQWCAHTVSHIAEEAGMNIGEHKASVREFVGWAGKRFRSIKTQPMTKKNLESERTNRTRALSKVIGNSQPGDFLVWNSNYAVNTDEGSLKQQKASHIGIIESIDMKNGTISILEGNANVVETSDKYDRKIVKTKEEGIQGNQEVGEFAEVNRRDGLIRKVYTFRELAESGCSGVIDTKGLS